MMYVDCDFKTKETVVHDSGKDHGTAAEADYRDAHRFIYSRMYLLDCYKHINDILCTDGEREARLELVSLCRRIITESDFLI